MLGASRAGAQDKGKIDMTIQAIFIFVLKLFIGGVALIMFFSVVMVIASAASLFSAVDKAAEIEADELKDKGVQ